MGIEKEAIRMINEHIFSQMTGSVNTRILKTYEELYRITVENTKHEVGHRAKIRRDIYNVLANHDGEPATFYLTQGFTDQLNETLLSLDGEDFEGKRWFIEGNASCPFPVTLFIFDNIKDKTIASVIGVRTETSIHFSSQAFLHFDDGRCDVGGKLFTFSPYEQRSKNGVAAFNEDIFNEKDISYPESWWSENVNDGSVNDCFNALCIYASLCGAAMKSNAVTTLAVDGSNKVKKLKEKSDEHKTYRVRYNKPPEGSRASPLFYSPRRNHEVRGHFRNYKSGKRVWISNHKRGDESLGVITKDYVVEAAE
jgi:hypothetical protein